jgi:hypothetical protein
MPYTFDQTRRGSSNRDTKTRIDVKELNKNKKEEIGKPRGEEQRETKFSLLLRAEI